MSVLRRISLPRLRPNCIRVSFDVDDTLVCCPHTTPSEGSYLPGFVRRWVSEPLREGTYALMRELRRRGCSIWIYTTSSRTPYHIRRLLLLHGIRVDGVVNRERHGHGLAAHGFRHAPSKFPPAFGIDLHVDDSEGVEMEGAEHGFRVLVIQPDDRQWVTKILDAVSHLQRSIPAHRH